MMIAAPIRRQAVTSARKTLLFACVTTLLCLTVQVGAQSLTNELSAVRLATESAEYDELKAVYRECVISKGKDFAKVSSVDSAIRYAPIACKREFLSIRQFLLSGAFRVDVIDELMDSVREGVEIDLVNTVYEEALKRTKR